MSFSLRNVAVAVVITSIVVLTSCGSGSSTTSPTSVTGNWSVTVYDDKNVPLYVFTTRLNQQIATPSSTSPVSGSKLNMTTDLKPCFTATASSEQTGVFTVDDNFNNTGLTTNTLRLNVKGSADSGPANLELYGTFNTQGVSGPWKLTMTSPNLNCLTSGIFLMTRI